MPVSNKLWKNPLISGTLLLTLAGVASRIIGFFYKIFLSRVIGAESLGLYQMVFPVLALCLSLTSAGIQTAVSRFVASSLNDDKKCYGYLAAGLFLSSILSLFVGILIYFNADWIAKVWLGDSRCASLLSIMTFCLIPTCVHACINGYYYGKKKSMIPSLSQITEQVARVIGVYLFYCYLSKNSLPLTASHAMWGLIIGEFFGMVVSGIAILFSIWKKLIPHLSRKNFSDCSASFSFYCSSLCSMAVPLTANRVLANIGSSIENTLIPQKLRLYGLTQAKALSIYGVLSGMSLSVIFFPSVITGSLSVLLLPAVSEATSKGEKKKVSHATEKAVRYGLLLGFIFTVIFLVSGDFIGEILFSNPLAGYFIRRLSWVCPFMFVSSLLGSILHGLGKAKTVLFINLLSCLIRIGMVFFLVPYHGMDAYLWALLISWVFSAVASMIAVARE